MSKRLEAWYYDIELLGKHRTEPVAWFTTITDPTESQQKDVMDTVLCKISGCAEQGVVSGLPCFVSLEFLYLARDQPGRRPKRTVLTDSAWSCLNCCWLAMFGSEFESSQRSGPPGLLGVIRRRLTSTWVGEWRQETRAEPKSFSTEVEPKKCKIGHIRRKRADELTK